jgi:hypothetical protein
MSDKTYISTEDEVRIKQLPPPPTFEFRKHVIPVTLCEPIPMRQFLYNNRMLGKPATDDYYYWMYRWGIYYIILNEDILWYIGMAGSDRVEGLAARVHEHSIEQIGRALIWCNDVTVCFHDMTNLTTDNKVIGKLEWELIHDGPMPLGNYDNEDWQAGVPLRPDIVIPKFPPTP